MILCQQIFHSLHQFFVSFANVNLADSLSHDETAADGHPRKGLPQMLTSTDHPRPPTDRQRSSLDTAAALRTLLVGLW